MNKNDITEQMIKDYQKKYKLSIRKYAAKILKRDEVLDWAYFDDVVDEFGLSYIEYCNNLGQSEIK